MRVTFGGRAFVLLAGIGAEAMLAVSGESANTALLAAADAKAPTALVFRKRRRSMTDIGLSPSGLLFGAAGYRDMRVSPVVVP
jgi:hypothetical protein